MTTNAPWRSRIVGHGEVRPADLIPNPRNWRKHPKRQRDAIEEVLERVGWVQDVVVNQRTGHIVDGHLRASAAAANGELTIPVVYVDLDPEEEALILAALDPLAGMASTDTAMLQELLGDVELGEGALASMFGNILPHAAGTMPAGNPNETPPVPDPAELYVHAGELWQLGRHRLLVGGDATRWQDVRRVLGGVNAQMAFTDPPYNVDYGRHGGASGKGRTTKQAILNDAMSPDDWALFIKAWSHNLLQHVAGAVYLCMSTKEWATVSKAMELAGGHWSDTIVWAKEGFTLGRADYQRGYEPIWYGWREGADRHFTASRKESDVWELDVTRGVVARRTEEGEMVLEFGLGLETVTVTFPSVLRGTVSLSGGEDSDLWHIARDPRKGYVHPNQKPVELVERALRNSSVEGDAVLDLFLGSGTTIIAAERTGRRAFGLELDPKFAQVIIERFKGYTGTEPVMLEGKVSDGSTEDDGDRGLRAADEPGGPAVSAPAGGARRRRGAGRARQDD